MVQSLIVANVGELVGELAEMPVPGLRPQVHGIQGRRPAGLPPGLLRSFPRGSLTLLQRYHGATRHVGKTSAAARGGLGPAPAAHRLREAVSREDYEEAARLRDLLRPRNSALMTLDDLTKTSGEWLRGTGPESDIVMCSRIRLARNLADFPFCNRASRSEKAEIEANFTAALVERQARALVSRRERPLDARPPVPGRAAGHLARAFLERRPARRRDQPARKRRDHGQRGRPPPRPVHALRLSPERSLGRRQRPGRQARRTARVRVQPPARLPDRLPDQRRHRHSRRRDAAPARARPEQAHRQGLSRLQKINLAVRGLYGEGSQASGDFYQISNQQTLGKSEPELIKILTDVVPQVLQYERAARQDLLTQRRQHLHDQVSRAYGVLKTAQTITSEETMLLLSSVRMGINLGLIDDLSIATVNELFIQTQPAFLQKLRGTELGVEERNVARASYLRSRLSNGRQPPR